ncbi:hypothetical protein BP5796_12541 [Coleophoma crateriformis]|uniref:Uncharacterized protein n=1 Tax=Coleophoma crateriformis TaxID=565419 RepID=A0A3D8Q7V2_9HELO|nr:hypothetical protein BP5796_12541 [Coleophoma crateriformis]
MLYHSGSMALSAGGSKHLLQAQLLQLNSSVATWSHLEVAGIELGSISALSVACNRETQPLDKIFEDWQKFFYKDTMAARSKRLSSFFYTLSFGNAPSPRDDAFIRHLVRERIVSAYKTWFLSVSTIWVSSCGEARK